MQGRSNLFGPVKYADFTALTFDDPHPSNQHHRCVCDGADTCI